MDLNLRNKARLSHIKKGIKFSKLCDAWVDLNSYLKSWEGWSFSLHHHSYVCTFWTGMLLKLFPGIEIFFPQETAEHPGGNKRKLDKLFISLKIYFTPPLLHPDPHFSKPWKHPDLKANFLKLAGKLLNSSSLTPSTSKELSLFFRIHHQHHLARLPPSAAAQQPSLLGCQPYEAWIISLFSIREC